MPDVAGDNTNQPENLIALEDALIALVVQYGARTVADKAQELYRHTKEWRDQQAAPTPQEDDVWERAARAQDTRAQAVSGRRQSALENARRLLGG